MWNRKSRNKNCESETKWTENSHHRKVKNSWNHGQEEKVQCPFDQNENFFLFFFFFFPPFSTVSTLHSLLFIFHTLRLSILFLKYRNCCCCFCYILCLCFSIPVKGARNDSSLQALIIDFISKTYTGFPVYFTTASVSPLFLLSQQTSTNTYKHKQ